MNLIDILKHRYLSFWSELLILTTMLSILYQKCQFSTDNIIFYMSGMQKSCPRVAFIFQKRVRGRFPYYWECMDYMHKFVIFHPKRMGKLL